MGSMFNVYTFAIEIFNFLVILAILYKIFYKPVINFMDNRRNEIARNISESEQGRAEAEKLLEEYLEMMCSDRRPADYIDRATKAGEELSLLAQSRDEAAKLLENARKEIQRERDDLQALRQEVVSLAMLAAETGAEHHRG